MKTTIMTAVIATAISTIIASVPAQAQTFYSITEIGSFQPSAINVDYASSALEEDPVGRVLNQRMFECVCSSRSRTAAKDEPRPNKPTECLVKVASGERRDRVEELV